MTDAELRTVLADRLAPSAGGIAAACARVGRDPAGVTLVAVTKTVSPRGGRADGRNSACLDLGENRPQELWRKAAELKHLPIRWHLIGHLQRNKVERTLPLVHLIHSIDSGGCSRRSLPSGRKTGTLARRYSLRSTRARRSRSTGSPTRKRCGRPTGSTTGGGPRVTD